jgi:hypothetical protein
VNEKKRLVREYRQVLCGRKEQIFKLLCPVREKEWLSGWDYTMIYSESGFAEKGCVFETDNDFGKYQWIITKHDIDNCEIQFVKFVYDKLVVIIDLNLFDGDNCESYCDIKYTFTIIDEALVEKINRENTQEVFEKHMKLWENSINFFIENGEILK